ncbi:amidohydrolase [Oceanospirillum sp.]|uniref:amidohydrolase n=1 Tax=Oceanospirillum sp. TaxID=2021254 RepID=UPI003A90B497
MPVININEEKTQNDLRVTLVQSELFWHQPEQNRAMFAEKLLGLPGRTDVVILPEMFTTGFSMEPEAIAEPADQETLQWMQQQAKSVEAVVCGSVAVKDNQGCYNRFYWVQPDGEWCSYDKHHLFRMAGEHEHYQAGQARPVISYKGWRIFPQICYDLRFPVWSRNHDEYDLAIYVANWPAVREHPWQVLLQARAIENLCYVAGVNRVGQDGNGLNYSGRSAVIDFKGYNFENYAAGESFISTYTLSLDSLKAFRQAFPAFEDADGFILKQNKL